MAGVMTQHFRNIFLIGWTLWLEAWRRKEVYVLVLVTVLLLVGLRFVHFFDLEGLGKFYREVSLKAMNVVSAFLVILLSARQLPREFRLRTIYPLLAKPVGRLDFLLGKFLGCWTGGIFCYFLFMVVFLFGSVTLDAPMHYGLFAQGVYLHLLSMAVLASLVFFLSMLLYEDAAITISSLLYLASQVLMNLMSFLYESVNRVAQWGIVVLHYVIPQLTLFDLSTKIVHSMQGEKVVWPPVSGVVLFQLTLYAGVYVLVFLAGAFLVFRRKRL